MQDTQEKYFTAENIKKHISISVDATYWFSKEGRINRDISDLYNLLFPMELEREGADFKKRKRLKAMSFQRAEELWRAIKENPQSPPGPLTLAAIFKAILEGADFDNISDRQAFFILMQNNADCRAMYHWGMRDNSVRANEDETSIKQLRAEFPGMVPSDDEARRLIRLWHGETDRNSSPYNSLNTKIKKAAQTKNNTFFKELFELAPKLAQLYSGDRDSPLFIGKEARFNPGFVEAACLGFEQPVGFLSHAIDRLDMIRILTQNIYWYNVIVNRRRVAGSFSMKLVYDYFLLDTSAFLAQVERPEPKLPERCFFQSLSIKRDCLLGDEKKESEEREYVYTLMQSEGGVEVVPSHSDLLEMFSEMANVVRNGLIYFIRYQRPEILDLISRIADLDYLAEDEDLKSLCHELRYRLYHPVTIRAMEAFWHENIDAFIRAAGKNDQYLAHLLRHLSNPASLLIKILRGNKLWIVPRIAKILPVIAKNSGSRARKDFNLFLDEVITEEGVQPAITVREQFKARVAELIDYFAAHFTDPNEELLSILDDPTTRNLSELSDRQLGQCLRINQDNAVNSRFESVIASDDQLYSNVQSLSAFLTEANESPEAESAVAEKFRTIFPTVYARICVEGIVSEGKLEQYVQESKAPRELAKPVYQICVREAYIIASHETFWREIDPYSSHSLRSLANWGSPGSQAAFFEAEKTKLSIKNPVFAIRMEWEKHRDTPFDRFLVDKLYALLDGIKERDGAVVVISDDTRTEILELIADIGRGEELFNLHRYGVSAVPQNPCRAKAFLAEINTPEKAALAWEFVQKINRANIDAEAIFCLMTRDEQHSVAPMRPRQTCFDLAVSLLEKNPSRLPQVVLMHTRVGVRLPHGAMERLSGVVKRWLNDERVVTPEALQELMRAGLLEIEFSTDIKLLSRLISVEVAPDLLSKIKALLFPDGDSSPENSRYSEPKPLNGARSDNGYLRDKLCAKDLLKLKEVAPLIFNKLMRECINLRQLKLCLVINKMSAQELSGMSFTGLGYLFANEPKFFYELLLRLPVEKLDPPVELIGSEYDDIFMLNEGKKRGGHDPILAHMKTIDLFQQDNIDLIMRCVNSQNRYLSRLMKEVLVQGIDEYEPKLAAEILRCYLTHPQADERFSRAILVDGPGLRSGFKRVLFETNFISVYLDKDKESGKFSEQALKLWSLLVGVKSFEEFVSSFQFDRSNKEQAAKEKTLFRLYSEYRVTLKTPAKASVVSFVAKDFSDLFSDSGSQENVFADGLSQENYRY